MICAVVTHPARGTRFECGWKKWPNDDDDLCNHVHPNTVSPQIRCKLPRWHDGDHRNRGTTWTQLESHVANLKRLEAELKPERPERPPGSIDELIARNDSQSVYKRRVVAKAEEIRSRRDDPTTIVVDASIDEKTRRMLESKQPLKKFSDEFGNGWDFDDATGELTYRGQVVGVGSRVKWRNHCDRFPHFSFGPGHGIVTEIHGDLMSGTICVLPESPQHRHEIWTGWGCDEADDPISGMCIMYTWNGELVGDDLVLSEALKREDDDR